MTHPQHWIFGATTLQRVVELEVPLMPPTEIFGDCTQAHLDANRNWLQPRFQDPATGNLVFSIQSYLVRQNGLTILVDSCGGNDKERARPHFHRQKRPWLDTLRQAGVAPEDVDIVLCTHLHVDHVGWNTRLENGKWVPTFPKAKYVFGKTEFDYWAGVHAKTPVPVIEDSVMPIVEAKRCEIVGDEAAIGDHVRILPTPGHTPGHSAFRLGRGKDDAVFSGDLMHSPIQTRFPEMSVKFDVDQAEAGKTRRSFLERYCDTDTLCCTAHFPSPSTGKIRRRGNGFSCQAVAAS
jgi:glyoxylase-like metal-dependent hydrolase (beta-lactamase superfamily II)